jgi:hypothetical protein
MRGRARKPFYDQNDRDADHCRSLDAMLIGSLLAENVPSFSMSFSVVRESLPYDACHVPLQWPMMGNNGFCLNPCVDGLRERIVIRKETLFRS